MAAVVALAAHMQMQVLMGFDTVMTVLMAVQFQPECRSHSEHPNHQQCYTHQKFRPGGHRFNVGQVLERDGNQGQHHHSG